MSDMSAKWIMIIYVILGMLLLILYPIISWIKRKKQKRLLQIQADKRGEQVNESSMLVLPMGAFRLLITSHISDIPVDKNNSKTMAILRWSDLDLSERVSHFSKIAVFRKQFLLRNSEKSQVRKKWKKILLGNERFDKAFSIYAENEADVHRILTDEIQRGLLALSSKSPRLKTDEMIIRNFFATSKIIRDTDTYDIFIDTAISISEKLTGTVYEPKQATGNLATESDTISENLDLSPMKKKKEISMSFFKNLFSKGEEFIPTPTQEVPGIPPIVVQAIENLFPNVDDQKNAFDCVLKLEERGRAFRDPRLLLALLSYSAGKIEKLQTAASQTHPHFWGDEIYPIFPKMRDAEEWVRSITKPKI